jgi:hypothetical protein
MRPVGIECEQFTLLVGFEHFVNRLYRAHGNTGAAIDADIRIYIASLAIRMEALDRAMFDAIGKEAEATIVRNDVGHATPDPELDTLHSTERHKPAGGMNSRRSDALNFDEVVRIDTGLPKVGVTRRGR